MPLSNPPFANGGQKMGHPEFLQGLTPFYFLRLAAPFGYAQGRL